MIQQAGSQFNEALLKSNEALIKFHEAVDEARDRPGIIVEEDTAQTSNLVTFRSNPHLKLLFGNLDFGEFAMNGVKVTYQGKSIIVRDNLSGFQRSLLAILITQISFSNIWRYRGRLKQN